ncbi:sensor histidine kinase [Nitritalea halalkaliphila]|uniref:sensor histidine kinase n=1 Tax=Nitritalea halalkaliphila TaxID=590849 RepID=UPI0009FE5137|nr:sensor histidine kinase [Nitritalea halalkaliphila]
MLITIADRGIGIPLSEQDKLFERFFRATNVGLVEGYGLGLAIVKRCVEELGGLLSFQSEEGKGTTFFLDLPQSLPNHNP